MSDDDCLFEVGLHTTTTEGEFAANVTTWLGGAVGKLVSPSCKVKLDLKELDTLLAMRDYDGYSRKLTESFFEDRVLDKAYSGARDIANFRKARLRIRLSIAPEARALHAVAWELLGDSDTAPGSIPLARDARRPLSRYLRPPILPLRRSSGRLRSVVLIANPRKLDGAEMTSLPEIEVMKQRDAVKAQLEADTNVCYLVGPDACTARLLDELKRGVDIVYLVCHGRLRSNVPTLFFEIGQQEVELVDSKLLVETIISATLPPPQLVIFGSCESAGGANTLTDWDGGVLSSVGALMVAAGVPAVVGMQGMILQTTNAKFSSAFFSALFEEGQVERAISLGRQAVAGAQDWWMPVLLLSKEDGQLWPSQNARQDFTDWDVLLEAIELGECTPVLGSEVLPPFSNREFAKILLSEMRDQLGPLTYDELAWVAQQFQVQRNLESVTPRFNTFIRKRIGRDKDGQANFQQDTGEKLQQYLSRWAEPQWALVDNPGAPTSQQNLTVLKHLASIPFPYYVTTNPDDLLEDALRKEGKTPIKQVCPWRGDMREVQSLNLDAVDEVSKLKPLVYHLFGTLEGKDQAQTTAVLTEDDFFKHLLWVSSNFGLIPITTPLCSSTLLFLGFHLQDWEFRVLLRCIESLPGRELLKDKPHIAVQIPLDGDPEKRRNTQQLLQQFFTKTHIKLSIYYGTAAEFTAELVRRRNS